MIDRHPSLPPPLLELPIRNGISHIPPHTPQNDVPLTLTAFEVDHAAASPPHCSRKSIAESSSDENLRQNPERASRACESVFHWGETIPR
jgi:hypothetical protein